jgi:hypothetical protein
MEEKNYYSICRKLTSVFLGLTDPNTLVRDTDLDPEDPYIIKQKEQENP